jgi:hypothetical protein
MAQQAPPDFRLSNLLIPTAHLVHIPLVHIHRAHTHRARIHLAHSLLVSRRHQVHHHQVGHLALAPTRMDDVEMPYNTTAYAVELADALTSIPELTFGHFD